MGEHRAFGTTGAPARVERDMGVAAGQPVVAERAGVEGGGPFGQLVEGQGRRGRAGGGAFRVGHDEIGPARGHDPGHLVCSEATVEGHQDGPDLGQGGEEGDRGEIGQTPEHHPGSPSHAERPEDACHPVGGRLERAEGERTPSEGGGGAIGHGERRIGEHLPDQQVVGPHRHSHSTVLAQREQ